MSPSQPPSYRGRSRSAIAFALGICLTLAMPPVFLLPFLVLAFTGLSLLVKNAPTAKRAATDGFFFGWGHYITSLYWIAISLLVDADQFGWLVPFCVFGLTAVIALYPMLACLVAWRARNLPAWGYATAFATVWTVMEYARGHLFTGFPWNLPAYSLGFSAITMQPAALVGAYGLSFLLVFLALIPIAWIERNGVHSLFNRLYVITILALCGLLLGWSFWRLQHAQLEYAQGAHLRIVQGNIEQTLKWDPARQAEGVKTHLRLSHAPGFESRTLIIWPETAVPGSLSQLPQLPHILAQAAPHKGFLLTGATHSEGDGEDFRIYNALIALDEEGNTAARYDKHHLVPFGEFVPLRAQFPEMARMLNVGGIDFSHGPGPQTLTLPGIPPFSPLICYEAIFPQGAVDKAKRPAWLLNITNDAWFGESSGPYQHLTMARFRAVEQGLPLIRAANTGISAVIDPYGRILQSLPLNTQGIIDSGLPMALPQTAYSRWSFVVGSAPFIR